MKKAGFTLAEVLITLTIIGVIAALTMPSLYHNVGTADIGPKLAKFRSTVENANRLLMADREVNRLSVLLRRGQNDDRTEAYTNLLQNFMHITPVINSSGNDIKTFNGDDLEQVNVNLFEQTNEGRAEANQIQIPIADAFNWKTSEGMAAHFFIAPAVNGIEPDNLGVILVDINGDDNPNRLGRDIFGFILRNDGFLTPIGARAIDHVDDGAADFADDSKNWAQSCPNKQGNVIGQGLTCTGSIFANDLKVIYLD